MDLVSGLDSSWLPSKVRTCRLAHLVKRLDSPLCAQQAFTLTAKRARVELPRRSVARAGEAIYGPLKLADHRELQETFPLQLSFHTHYSLAG